MIEEKRFQWFCFSLHPLNEKSVISWTPLTSVFLGGFEYAFELLLSFRSLLQGSSCITILDDQEKMQNMAYLPKFKMCNN